MNTEFAEFTAGISDQQIHNLLAAAGIGIDSDARISVGNNAEVRALFWALAAAPYSRVSGGRLETGDTVIYLHLPNERVIWILDAIAHPYGAHLGSEVDRIVIESLRASGLWGRLDWRDVPATAAIGPHDEYAGPAYIVAEQKEDVLRSPSRWLEVEGSLRQDVLRFCRDFKAGGVPHAMKQWPRWNRFVMIAALRQGFSFSISSSFDVEVAKAAYAEYEMNGFMWNDPVRPDEMSSLIEQTISAARHSLLEPGVAVPSGAV